MILKFIILKQAHTKTIHNVFKKKSIARFEIFGSYLRFFRVFCCFRYLTVVVFISYSILMYWQ